MSLWAFGGPMKPPDGFEDFASPSRRVFRISQINCFIFPFMNILWVLSERWAGLSPWSECRGATAMAVATVFMTVPLFASLKWHPARYGTVVGITSLIAGIGILALGLLRA